ncbi:nitrogenase component 1 [Natronospora cellulosivora (SeqCode)]
MDKNIKNLNINPCKMCMPMGAALAMKGIENSIMFLHGSQGCSTYIRRHMATHFNEPVDIASSSLTETGTVYGGKDNLYKGLENTINLYQPEIIATATTCLAETIGEDIDGLLREYKLNYNKSVNIIPVTTPGYGGSQYEGYYLTLRKVLETLSFKTVKEGHINIITAGMTPGDIRRLKEIVESFSLDYIIFPDISETLDGTIVKDYKKIPKGGTSISDIKRMSGAIATIEFAKLVKADISPGKYLEEEYAVPLYNIAVPIGLENTDVLVNLLSEISGKEIPEKLRKAKGRMLDGMIDAHKYNAEGKAAVFGEPELVYSVSTLCLENGIKPTIIATGSEAKQLRKLLNNDLLSLNQDGLILDDIDFEEIRKLAVEGGTNILIGNSDGHFITERDGIPLVRIGFPIHDHIGAQRKVFIGYEGSIRFLEDITNTLLDRKHDSYRERMYQQYYK